MTTDHPEGSLVEHLDRALRACDEALCAYESGLLDDDELRRALFRAGMVVHDGEAWLVDLDGARWARWDGLGVETTRGPAAAPSDSGHARDDRR